MKKWLVRLGILAGIFVVILIGIAANLSSIVSTTLAEAGPKIVGAPIKLDDVSVNLLTGRVTLSGFELGNPEGFKTDRAMAFDRVHVDLALSSLMTDTIIIDNIEIDAPEITFEGGLGNSNLSQIQKNIEDFTGPSEEPAVEEEPAPETGPAKDILIRSFTMNDSKVNLSMKILQGAAAPIFIKRIHQENIGTEDGGVSPGKAVGLVFSFVLQAITSDVGAALKNIASGAVEGVKVIGDGLKDVGEGTLEGVKNVGEGVGKGIQNVGDGLKGIFGGDKKDD